MTRKFAVLVCAVALLLLPSLSGAGLDRQDFQVKTTEDLVDLCSPSSDSPIASQAIHFCEGFCVGAYQYYQATSSGPDGSQQWVCFEKPYPSRDSVIAMFVEWAKAHPQYMNDKPVDSLFRFLMEKWPCKK